MPCPICKEDAETTPWPAENGVHVKCQRCGPYVLAGRLVRVPKIRKLLQDTLDQEPQARARASQAIRSRTSDDNPFKITTDNLHESGLSL